ncbi:MAG: response regulator [Melioribacteraceae bacterium]
MNQALKVINFDQNNSRTESHKNSTQKTDAYFSKMKVLVFINYVFAISVVALYVLNIEIIQAYRNEFLFTVVGFISLSTFLLGSIRNNSKSYKLKLVKNKKNENISTDISLKDSIIPYFKISIDGNFICNNKSMITLLGLDNSSSLNFFDDLIKNKKIKKHILLKLENKKQLENYRLQLTNTKGEIIYVNMSTKFFPVTKTIEGSLIDVTSQHLKEKTIAEEIERLKTELLIAENENLNDTNTEEQNSKIIHDLKSPLNSIFGFLTLIENHHYETEEELIEYTKNAKKAGEHLVQTIDQNFETEKEINTNKDISSQVEENTSTEVLDTPNEEIIDFTFTNFDVQNSLEKNILLVEDNPMNQEVEIKLLEKAGYNVFAIETGEEAIEQVKTNKFDLVLMDIELPGISGLEATKEIRNLEEHLRNIPVIAATARSSMKDREKCLDAGMNDYISKPINISFMKMTIEQWLKPEVIFN